MKRNYSRNEKKSKRIKDATSNKEERPSTLSESGREAKWNLEQVEEKKKKEEKMGCCSLFDRITDVDEFCYKTDKIAFAIFAIAFFLYNLVYIIVYTA